MTDQTLVAQGLDALQGLIGLVLEEALDRAVAAPSEELEERLRHLADIPAGGRGCGEPCGCRGFRPHTLATVAPSSAVREKHCPTSRPVRHRTAATSDSGFLTPARSTIAGWRVVMDEEAPRPIVLVVEDEPLVRMLAADVLEEADMEVIEAATATAALAILERRSDIVALFTDIDMPGGLNGLDLARIVHERWPDIAIVVTSGVTRVGVDALPGGGVFINKPYASSTPVRVIRELVRRRPVH